MAKAARNAQGSAAPAQGRTGELDWGNLRFFLEMARSGSLSKAARKLAVDRNTVARRVTTLEAELGLSLFERGPSAGRARRPATSSPPSPPASSRTCSRSRCTPARATAT
jgi:hypothetical protein